MKEIEIHAVPHSNQRYDTVGDYQENSWRVLFTVSIMKDWRSEAAVAIHELVEYFLCKRSRIKLEDIDLFDMHYEGAGEPGDNPLCPYAKQHRFAENIERLLVAELGLTWQQHERNVDDASVGTRPAGSAGTHGGVRRGGAGVATGPGGNVCHGQGADQALEPREDPEDNRPGQAV